ncbi:MAG: SPOR domain-containing protein [Acetobacteraceae bacterium]
MPATWAIQVGSFSTEKAARRAASAGRRVADGGEVSVESAMVKRRTTWRAQVIGLTSSDAQAACAALAKRKSPCIVIKPDAKQVASR